ncbi:hypothetical protein VPH35_062129 [Triticum aestivum]
MPSSSSFVSAEAETRNWAELPLDVISSILHKLDQLARSKPGPDHVHPEPELWRRINMLGHPDLSRKFNLHGMAHAAVRRSAGRCEAFWCEHAGGHDFLLRLADQAPSLKSLRLISCYKFSDEALTEAMVKFPLLEELELALCSNVGESGVLGVVGKACPQLKSFRLIKDVLYDSEANDYDKDDEAMGIATMHGLRSLQLFGNSLTNKGLTAILDNCRHLESLDIRHCFNVYMDNTLRTKCARISTLWLILPKLGDVGMTEQFIRPQTSDRGFPRIISSPSMDSRGDLSAIENQVHKLIDDLRSDSIEGQRSATLEIRLLAKHNMENRIVIADCGAINLLVGLLHSPDAKIQENAVTSLLNLSISDNNKIATVNANVVDPLIHVLETGNPEAKENSAATLFSLCILEENKGHIVQADAVKQLVKLMDPAAGMVDKAVAVLANLATIAEGRTAIGQARGIPALVDVVELGSARGKENAVAALLQLCKNSNRSCSIVLQEGVLPPLVTLSRSGTPRAREKVFHFR